MNKHKFDIGDKVFCFVAYCDEGNAVFKECEGVVVSIGVEKNVYYYTVLGTDNVHGYGVEEKNIFYSKEEMALASSSCKKKITVLALEYDIKDMEKHIEDDSNELSYYKKRLKEHKKVLDKLKKQLEEIKNEGN